ncbi:uncharacterized protein LOC127704552 isoform X1 [Mytilus californianus]|uniref:uncharacterized protein LOC127704552 isoform X1 n=1 Tax=Mytilus californianus TaxID=6549 RepID=UPI0022462122|nr:uncharacterized protein LOC127704552 isoform X1 [Mytilus californianus]
MALELPTLQEGLKSIAVAASGLLAGTAVYISVVEVKSRAKLDIKSMRKQWSDSFDNAAVFVLGVGTVNTAANVVLFFMDTSPYKNLWLVEPCLFIIGGIYTSIVMLPEIRELKNDEIVAKKGDIYNMCVCDFIHITSSVTCIQQSFILEILNFILFQHPFSCCRNAIYML